MQRQRDGLVPIGEALADLSGPVQALREASPQARHHFTRFDQVNQLVSASEADPDLGFMVRMMALCSLPRTNPGNQKEYIRCNGPYTLGMTAGLNNKLPFGNYPRLLLAWVCTEAVQTQSPVLILGSSLSEFMRTLGVYSSDGKAYTRLRNQMDRLFNAHVSLIYEDKRGKATVNSLIADSTAFWWNPKRPEENTLWESKIELSEKFFNEIINHPVPLDMNTLTALKRCAPGTRPVPMAHLPHLYASCSVAAHLATGVPPVRLAPLQSQRQAHRPKLPPQGSTRVEEDQNRLAGSQLLDGSGRPDRASLNSRDRTAQSRPARPLVSPFLPLSGPSAAFPRRGGALGSIPPRP